jgi:hypothetical protein
MITTNPALFAGISFLLANGTSSTTMRRLVFCHGRIGRTRGGCCVGVGVGAADFRGVSGFRGSTYQPWPEGDGLCRPIHPWMTQSNPSFLSQQAAWRTKLLGERGVCYQGGLLFLLLLLFYGRGTALERGSLLYLCIIFASLQKAHGTSGSGKGQDLSFFYFPFLPGDEYLTGMGGSFRFFLFFFFAGVDFAGVDFAGVGISDGAGMQRKGKGSRVIMGRDYYGGTVFVFLSYWNGVTE